MKKIYSIVEKYTEYPGPRYRNQGEHSGQAFFEDVLDNEMGQAIKKDTQLLLDLDGTAGYGSSFLDEAIGNLVLKYTKDKVLKHLKIKSEIEPDWEEIIYRDIIPEWEEKRTSK